MVTSKTIRTVTDMRKDADGLLEFAMAEKKPIGIFRHNKLAAYLIDPETFEKLEEFVENYSDLELAGSRLGNKKNFRNFDEFWKKENLPK